MAPPNLHFLHIVIYIVGASFVLWAFFALLEQWRPLRKQPHLTRQSGIDAGFGLLNVLAMAVITPISALLTMHVLTPYAPHHLTASFVQASPLLPQFVVAIFLFDLIQYVRHRFTHKFLWGCHATHHSAQELRALVHFRLHPLDYVLSAIFSTFFLYLLGFESPVILWANGFMLVNNMWLHVNMDVGYGPLARVLVSPNYHKWHHANTAQAIDKNFADLFIILDRIGGTYLDPARGKPKAYGLHGVAKDAPVHQGFWAMMLYPIRRN